MTFECTLNVTGIRPEVSHRAFIQSYQTTSNPQYLKKHSKRIESFFKGKLSKSMSQAQIPQKIEKSFSVNFKNSAIYFKSSSKAALRYEFGSGKTPPKRFIEPVFIETANEVSNILITDAIDLYNRNAR